MYLWIVLTATKYCSDSTYVLVWQYLCILPIYYLHDLLAGWLWVRISRLKYSNLNLAVVNGGGLFALSEE